MDVPLRGAFYQFLSLLVDTNKPTIASSSGFYQHVHDYLTGFLELEATIVVQNSWPLETRRETAGQFGGSNHSHDVQ